MRKYEELYTEEAIQSLADAGLSVPPKDKMTCNGCAEAETCDLAWDLYNTDGDCLACK